MFFKWQESTQYMLFLLKFWLRLFSPSPLQIPRCPFSSSFPSIPSPQCLQKMGPPTFRVGFGACLVEDWGFCRREQRPHPADVWCFGRMITSVFTFVVLSRGGSWDRDQAPQLQQQNVEQRRGFCAGASLRSPLPFTALPWSYSLSCWAEWGCGGEEGQEDGQLEWHGWLGF